MTSLEPPDDATEYHQHRAELAWRFANQDETRRRAVDEIVAALDDRPRYRALARRWYDHGSDDCVPSDDDHGGHASFCHSGWELTVYRVDADWREVASGRYHEPLGVTQTDRPTWDVTAIRAAVVDYLRARADPLPTRAAPDDVEVYREVPW